MIEGFTQSRIDTGEVALSVHRAGRGAPLILLHGFPQNHACWRKVAPALAKDFDVLVPDLRGYGDSDAPPDDAGHDAYSKRVMARDVCGLMDALGIERAHVLGHDRGGRVAYRLALDAPERVDRLGIVEIVPTANYWDAWGPEMALAAYHWTFLAQPAPMPERLIGADPAGWIDWTLKAWTLGKSLDVFGPALEGYRAQAAVPERLGAMCADYRAGAGPDRRHDEADRAAGRRISAPLCCLWGETGFPSKVGDPLAIWRGWASDVTGRSCRSGHFVMEENPEAVIGTFRAHFAA